MGLKQWIKNLFTPAHVLRQREEERQNTVIEQMVAEQKARIREVQRRMELERTLRNGPQGHLFGGPTDKAVRPNINTLPPVERSRHTMRSPAQTPAQEKMAKAQREWESRPDLSAYPWEVSPKWTSTPLPSDRHHRAPEPEAVREFKGGGGTHDGGGASGDWSRNDSPSPSTSSSTDSDSSSSSSSSD